MYQPIIVGAGLGAWQFLQRTYDRQLETFSKAPQLQRDVDHFARSIGNVKNATELVSDRRLLGVALGAFGLQDDINNRYFIQKMLEEGTTADDALANRFTDSRYRDFSAAFGFGPNEFPRNTLKTFPDEIIARFKANNFEVATGLQDDSMRTSLYAKRILPDLLSKNESDRTKWFSIMGQPPLRKVFESALNLPSSFAQIDIDRQLEVFQDRTRAIFGVSNVTEFQQNEKLSKLIDRFILNEQVRTFSISSSPAANALFLIS